MSRRLLRQQKDVCQLCDFMQARNSLPTQAYRPRKSFTVRPFSSTFGDYAQRSPISRSSAVLASTKKSFKQPTEVTKTQHLVSQAELENGLQKLRSISDNLLSDDRALSEAEVVFVLSHCNNLAANFVPESPPPYPGRKEDAASVLLSLDESKMKKISPLKLPPPFRRMLDELSRIAFSIVKHPTVFITPKVLEVYTTVQSRLGKPESFPEVFEMYANKPLPEEGSSPATYKKQNPNKVANAIPLAVASGALQTAIDAKQLGVAMDIIDSAYTKPAFLRAKFVRQGLLPATALTVAPFAAWVIATKLAELQTSMDTATATNVAFAGILAYVGFTGVIGVVAVTTANDQMDRVTWAPGMPLRQRWIREDERAAIDRIAGAWGFRESWRRGEEEGVDWDNLREWIGRRGMILDRVSLMEGME
ncbi:hypothetical protein D0Z07_3787 [Hyphodiscus hymeniophilus]|uniref:Uncharacterized protein n=1 Tax=Hyphodiscus hymeniophilus TaxID=353542 RepID=A0A9P6VLC4_9HELO|nr:hypothetical protein D0Z07_3787 [Hyphodiscus hymeniophilus]